MELLKKYFEDISPVQLKQLEALKDLFAEWNAKINVISRKDLNNFYEHHVLHSLCISALFDLPTGYEVMDLGCGGGFPGIPLAIFFPEAAFLMVDSINKKLTVVSSIAAAIGLQNITTLHSRAEEIGKRKFDLVISRAVAPLKDLWRWSKPLLKKASSEEDPRNHPIGLICLKGGDLGQEIVESNCKPLIWEIDKVFQEEYFKEKYLLYIPNK